MYWGTNAKKKLSYDHAFQRTVDEHGNLKVDGEPNCLIGTIRKLGVGRTLTQATVVIICEPIYNLKLYKQAPRRAHRLGQKQEVYVYWMSTDTPIEDMVAAKCKISRYLYLRTVPHIICWS